MADESPGDLNVRYEMRGPAAWITLASSATRNALSGPMIDALGAEGADTEQVLRDHGETVHRIGAIVRRTEGAEGCVVRNTGRW